MQRAMTNQRAQFRNLSTKADGSVKYGNQELRYEKQVRRNLQEQRQGGQGVGATSCNHAEQIHDQGGDLKKK